MEIINVADITGMEFPAGRRTRVMVGPGAKLEAANFVMGHVTIYPGGSVPIHSHEQEEVYFIVEGEGSIEVGGESRAVRSGDCIYIRPQLEHVLTNSGQADMVMMFCYSPKTVAAHWAQEMKGADQA